MELSFFFGGETGHAHSCHTLSHKGGGVGHDAYHADGVAKFIVEALESVAGCQADKNMIGAGQIGNLANHIGIENGRNGKEDELAVRDHFTVVFGNADSDGILETLRLFGYCCMYQNMGHINAPAVHSVHDGGGNVAGADKTNLIHKKYLLLQLHYQHFGNLYQILCLALFTYSKHCAS